MKTMSTKERNSDLRPRRPPILRDNQELGVIAAKAGHFTIRSLAQAAGRSDKVVTEVLRREKPAPLAEKAIAEALGISVNRLRALTEPKPEAANPQPMAAAA